MWSRVSGLDFMFWVTSTRTVSRDLVKSSTWCGSEHCGSESRILRLVWKNWTNTDDGSGFTLISSVSETAFQAWNTMSTNTGVNFPDPEVWKRTHIRRPLLRTWSKQSNIWRWKALNIWNLILTRSNAAFFIFTTFLMTSWMRIFILGISSSVSLGPSSLVKFEIGLSWKAYSKESKMNYYEKVLRGGLNP